MYWYELKAIIHTWIHKTHVVMVISSLSINYINVWPVVNWFKLVGQQLMLYSYIVFPV